MSSAKNVIQSTLIPKEKSEKNLTSDGKRNKLMERRLLIMGIIELGAFLFIVVGALCWTLICVEGLQVAQEYGFVLKHNFVHAFGSLFIILFLIMFPLNYLMGRCDRFFTRAKRDIWRQS